MPIDLSTIYIVSKKVAHGRDDRGLQHRQGRDRHRAASSSSQYVPGDRVELVRNDDYWGDKPPWEKVTLQLDHQRTGARRGAARGRRRRIEEVPTADLARLKTNAERGAGARWCRTALIYLHFDQLPRPVALRHRQGRQAARRRTRSGRARAARDLQGDQPPRHRRPRHGRRRRRRRRLVLAERLLRHQPEAQGRGLRSRRRARSCWPRPAIPTASTSRSTGRTTATSTTRRSCRRSRRC